MVIAERKAFKAKYGWEPSEEEAKKLKSDKAGKWGKMFDTFDGDHNGYADEAEFNKGLQSQAW